MIVRADLVERLERVEAEVVARDLRRRGDAVVEPWCTGYLTVVPGQPARSRAHGITMEDLSADDVAQVVAFYDRHDMPAHVQLSAWAPAGTVDALAAAGFVPAWSRSVHALGLDAWSPGPGAAGPFLVQEVTAEDLAAFLTTLLAGFGRTPLPHDRERAAAELEDPSVGQWLVLDGDHPVAAGLAHDVDGDVFLGPMATLEEHRGRGAQASLFAARLGWAAARGAATVSVTSSPDSATARNAERAGLRLVQQQVVLRRPRESVGC